MGPLPYMAGGHLVIRRGSPGDTEFLFVAHAVALVGVVPPRATKDCQQGLHRCHLSCHDTALALRCTGVGNVCQGMRRTSDSGSVLSWVPACRVVKQRLYLRCFKARKGRRLIGAGHATATLPVALHSSFVLGYEVLAWKLWRHRGGAPCGMGCLSE